MKTRSGHLFKRNGIYYLQWRINRKLFMRSTRTKNLKEAREKQKEIMAPFVMGDEVQTLQNIASRIEGRKAELAVLDDKNNPPLNVEDAWKAYDKAGNRREISDGTMWNYEGYWKTFTKWLSDTHADIVQLRQITFEVCEEYKEYLISTKKVTGRTFNAHRAFLRSLFNVLADKAKIEVNPWVRITKRDEHSIGRRPLTIEELRKVCQSAEGELRPLLALGLYLGCRLGDAVCMEWGHIDMIKRIVRYIPSKTARKCPDALEIPIHPELHSILSETPTAKRKGYVCSQLATDYLEKGHYTVSAIIQKHFEDCKIKTTEKRKGGGLRNRVIVGFHSLRHTAVSMLAEAGAVRSISQAIVGHNSPEVHALYTHTDPNAMRRAIDSMPYLNEANKPKELSAKNEDSNKVDKDVIRELADKLTAKNWKEIKTKLLKITGKE